MVSLNPEILKCSDGGAYNVPLPDIQRGGNDAAGNTPDIEKRPRPTPWRFTVSFWGVGGGREGGRLEGKIFSFPSFSFFFLFFIIIYSTEHDTPRNRKRPMKKRKERCPEALLLPRNSYVSRDRKREVSKRDLRGWMISFSFFFFSFFFLYNKFLWHR